MKIDIEVTETRKIIHFRPEHYSNLVVLGKYNYNKAENSLDDHVHENMIEICYYDKGSQWFCVDSDRYLVKGGDVFIHYPGEIHGSGGYPEGKGLLYWFIIEVPKASGNADRKAVEEIAYLCHALIKKGERHFKGEKEMKPLLEEIFLTYDKSGHEQIGNIRINTLVKRFLLLLLDCIEKKEAYLDDRLKSVLAYINEHIATNISLSLLADVSCLSESRFKNLFKEQTGFTPGDYIQRIRIQKAMEIIDRSPDISLSQVAYQLNFSSPQYLSSVIKKYTGVTPSALRKNRGLL